MIIVGLDPDSKKHGVAVYRDGKLSELHNLALVGLRDWIDQQAAAELVFSIEDVASQNFVYARNQHKVKAAQSTIAVYIGRCQQAQEEVMRELAHRGIAYQLHKPSGGNWATNKERFEKVTGWNRRSNEETRSAAFFGFIAVTRATKEVRRPLRLSTYSGRVEVLNRD